MNKVYAFLFAIFGVITMFNLYSLNFKPSQQEVVFIDIKTVFDSFLFKKEKEKELSHETESISRVLDSLAFEIQAIAKLSEASEENPYKDKLKLLQDQYYQRRTFYENSSVEMTRKFDQQILTQLKQYIEEYGKENGLKYVLSKSEEGVVLFGNEQLDRTQEVIQFINEKYQGK